MKELIRLFWALGRICTRQFSLWGLVLLLGVGCADNEPTTPVTAVPPTPTIIADITPERVTTTPDDLLVIATDAPLPPFTDFNKFGEVVGFNEALMAEITAVAGFEAYEFVVTPIEGVLEGIINRSGDDFDVVMANLILPETPLQGIVYTIPYLEIGQVLVILADEQNIQSIEDLQPGMAVGVARYSSSEQTARALDAIANNDLLTFEGHSAALQALIDEVVDAVIIDHFNAQYFTTTFPEQLKVVGEAEAAWISRKSYSLAVAADNAELLLQLNEAIETVHNENLAEIASEWLVDETVALEPGESRVGTPSNELVIGMVGQLTDLDPISLPTLINWELLQNTMSGLYRWNSQNQLEPILATGLPTVSEDGLTYTINLRSGLQFPDGTDFTAVDVQRSILRSASLGTGNAFLVNNYLKDSDGNSFADEDAVQVVDETTVQFVLQAPTPFLLSLLTTPPYYPVSECYQPTYDPGSRCGGIGPYTITSRESNRIRLAANPAWPGSPPPAFNNIQVRFYDDPTLLSRALLEFQSVDMVWTGMPAAAFEALATQSEGEDALLRLWQGGAVFKSYLMFEQSTPPWDKEAVRQAVNYAVDREALASDVFAGARQPLRSPIPNGVPGYQSVHPDRDIAEAQALLQAEGYSEANPLPITIWYLGDGRYSDREAAYAEAIKAQLEETGIFQVTLVEDASWEQYRSQINSCNYAAYLLGWPTPNQTVNYFDVTSWTDFFVQPSSRGFCSNYESEAMATLLTEAAEESDSAARLATYQEIQTLWATDLPTLDLTQAPRQALSLTKIENVAINGMGLLHYELLTKTVQ